jgi:hypothetical protein
VRHLGQLAVAAVTQAAGQLAAPGTGHSSPSAFP